MGADVESPQRYLGYDDALTGDTTVNMYTFGTTWTMNPTTVFDATIRHLEDDPRVHRRRFRPRQLRSRRRSGIPGMNGGANFSSDPRYAGMPAFLTRLLRPLGNNPMAGTPVQRDERTYALAGNMTKLHGRSRNPVSATRSTGCGWTTGSRSWATGRAANFEFAANATALKGGAQTAEHLQQLRGVPAGPRRLARPKASRTS